MSFYPASSRIASAPGLLTVCLLVGFSACQRPAVQFQRSNREVFYPATPIDSTVSSPGNVPGFERTQPPIAYAEATKPMESAGKPVNNPVRHTYPIAERIREHQTSARRLLTPTPDTDTPIPVSEHQPGPKPKKTLRQILGLPPRKKLNWWQRISWQLKASVVVILIAVVFAILGITVLAIVFGIIGAFLLIRGLKKSFKVRRGIFGLGG